MGCASLLRVCDSHQNGIVIRHEVYVPAATFARIEKRRELLCGSKSMRGEWVVAGNFSRLIQYVLVLRDDPEWQHWLKHAVILPCVEKPATKPDADHLLAA